MNIYYIFSKEVDGLLVRKKLLVFYARVTVLDDKNNVPTIILILCPRWKMYFRN